MQIRSKVVIFIATGCYIGNIPVAPGTFGTIAGLLPCFLLSAIDFYPAVFCTAIFVLFAIFIAHDAEKIFNKKDPGSIIIDEIAGMMVTMLGIPFNILSIVLGFIIFRIFDVKKPMFIRSLGRRIPGGAGIVADDIAAGIISNLILRVILRCMSYWV